MLKNLLLAALLCLSSATCLADDHPIPVEQLPAAAKTFIQQNFPAQTIIYAERDPEFSGTKYEARLDDGTKIEFDKKGNWDKVDCQTKPVPAALVPAPIATYVSTTFPNTQIVKIDKERFGYEIELSNDLELKFNKKGALIGMDD